MKIASRILFAVAFFLALTWLVVSLQAKRSSEEAIARVLSPQQHGQAVVVTPDKLGAFLAWKKEREELGKSFQPYPKTYRHQQTYRQLSSEQISRTKMRPKLLS